jgi:hypothetical protein
MRTVIYDAFHLLQAVIRGTDYHASLGVILDDSDMITLHSLIRQQLTRPREHRKHYRKSKSEHHVWSLFHKHHAASSPIAWS